MFLRISSEEFSKIHCAENEQRDAAFRRIIRSVPKGKVSTYGKVAAAAGYPLYHRAVASLLQKEALHSVPWQRIVGEAARSNSAARLPRSSAFDSAWKE